MFTYIKVRVLVQSCTTLCDPWTVAHQAPLSMGFSRQEYWSDSLLQGDLPDPVTEPWSLALLADSLSCKASGREAPYICIYYNRFLKNENIQWKNENENRKIR